MFRLENLRASTFIDKVIAVGDLNKNGIEDDGWIKGFNEISFLALPCRAALKKWVRLTLPRIVIIELGGESVEIDTGEETVTVVQVLDVGPYTWLDDKFILNGVRPIMEKYHQDNTPLPARSGYTKWLWNKPPPTRAGIDCTPKTWQNLGVTEAMLPLFRVSKYESLSIENMTMEWFIECPLDKQEIEPFPEWL